MIAFAEGTPGMREHMAKAQWVSKEKPNRKPDVVVSWHLWVLRETCASVDSCWVRYPSSLVLTSMYTCFPHQRHTETG